MTKSTYDWLAPAGEGAESTRPAVDGSVEAAQVDKFLGMEAEIMKRVHSATPPNEDETVETTPTEAGATNTDATPTEMEASALPPAVEIEVLILISSARYYYKYHFLIYNVVLLHPHKHTAVLTFDPSSSYSEQTE